ncbi:EF-hand domain-containing protein [Nocardiopsis synnemataformans]|uniref:EF-hand domain-containing protein n=1 Tax=Nocardiopsis synnemataformans TaxID=61305 RepID=UPI003EBCE91C
MTTASADPIATRYGRLFDAFDTDEDGRVEWDDFQRLVDRYLAVYGVDRYDRRAQALLSCYQMLWVELLRHSNADTSRLNRDQFVEALRLTTVDTSRFNMNDGLPHAVFDLIDADGDNEISVQEGNRFLESQKTVSHDAVRRFAKLDADGDGRISRQEFIRAHREFLHSADPEAAGGVAFGVL